MRMKSLGIIAAIACSAFVPAASEEYNPGKARADEPVRKEVSFARARQYLDHAALGWTKARKCAACHTNVPYLMAGPSLGKATDAEKKVRDFFEAAIKKWKPGEGDERAYQNADAVITAVALAFHDAQTTAKLSDPARKGLDRIWTLQQENGGWEWIKCKWPPLEHDDYFGAVLAAVGVGHAPDGYASTEKAKAGLAKLRGYFKKNAPPTVHHKAILLWASMKLDGLMTAAERAATVKQLKGLQKVDGGWSLPSLGDWEGYDGRDNNTKAGSDGYATGLMVFVLRQAGVPKDDAAVKKGVTWLKSTQRESGRWFTQSLNTDRTHYISNAGTAYAVMALKACE